MAKAIDNTAELARAKRKMKNILTALMLESLTRAAYALLVDAETSKEYHNLTGNTLTSYMVGIYENGKLRRLVSIYQADSLKRPTSRKLSQGDGKGVIRVEDYDSGKIIPVKKYKLLKTDEGYGYNTSKLFLFSYRPKTTKGFSLVMCTGTEYSEYLESLRNLNTLTETFRISAKAILSNLKPIQ